MWVGCGLNFQSPNRAHWNLHTDPSGPGVGHSWDWCGMSVGYYETYVGCMWDRCGICWEFLWVQCGISVGPALTFLGISVGYLRDYYVGLLWALLGSKVGFQTSLPLQPTHTDPDWVCAMNEARTDPRSGAVWDSPTSHTSQSAQSKPSWIWVGRKWERKSVFLG